MTALCIEKGNLSLCLRREVKQSLVLKEEIIMKLNQLVILAVLGVSALSVSHATIAKEMRADRGGANHSYGDNSYRENSYGEKRGHRSKNFIRHAFAKLDLTDEQKASIKSIKQSEMQKNEATREQLIDLKLEMRKQLKADNVDEAQVKALSAQVSELKADLTISRAKAKKQMIALLTEEQQAKLKKMTDKRRERMKKRAEVE